MLLEVWVRSVHAETQEDRALLAPPGQLECPVYQDPLVRDYQDLQDHLE